MSLIRGIRLSGRWRLALIALAFLPALTCRAFISFDVVTWETPGDTEGWVSLSGDSVGAVTQQGSGGNPSGYLQMSFGAESPPVVGQTDSMVNTGDGYTGDYGGYPQLQLAFDFLGYPSSVQYLYFESGAGGGSSWTYALASDVNDWKSYAVDFSAQGAWQPLSGSESWATALSQVDLIGVLVEHDNVDTAFTYGLDNWQFSAGMGVPEPAEVVLVLTGLAGMAATLRKKKRHLSA